MELNSDKSSTEAHFIVNTGDRDTVHAVLYTRAVFNFIEQSPFWKSDEISRFLWNPGGSLHCLKETVTGPCPAEQILVHYFSKAETAIFFDLS
jgi:hypothetical protein